MLKKVLGSLSVCPLQGCSVLPKPSAAALRPSLLSAVDGRNMLGASFCIDKTAVLSEREELV